MTCEVCEQPLTTSRQKRFCSKSCQRKAAHNRNYQKYKSQYARRRAAWRANNPIRTKFLYAKADIKRRGRGELDITYEQCQELWAKNCSYCNKDLLSEKGCSLDRLDNNKGYTIENVAPCCGDCNTIKSDILTFDEMKVAMKAVLEFRKRTITDPK